MLIQGDSIVMIDIVGVCSKGSHVITVLAVAENIPIRVFSKEKPVV